MSVRTIAPDEHDRAFSLTSHLPHALSTALANSQVIDDKPYVGSGLAGMIRLAKSEPAVWQSIFEYKRKYVLEAFDRFDAEIRKFREALSAGDFAALENLLNDGRKISKSLGD
jgi:prephenate dehydrogenase